MPKQPRISGSRRAEQCLAEHFLFLSFFFSLFFVLFLFDSSSGAGKLVGGAQAFLLKSECVLLWLCLFRGNETGPGIKIWTWVSERKSPTCPTLGLARGLAPAPGRFDSSRGKVRSRLSVTPPQQHIHHTESTTRMVSPFLMENTPETHLPTLPGI